MKPDRTPPCASSTRSKRPIAPLPTSRVPDRPFWGERLRIAGLRSRRVARFPYLIFYVEQEDHIEVRRVLHAKRDIPAWLEE
jgi:hypothetical protein